jgi:hypothetical protein
VLCAPAALCVSACGAAGADGVDRNAGTGSCANPGETLCPPPAPDLGPRCADLSTDRGACGACGHACGPLEVCDHGACATPEPQPCAPGLTWCGLSIYSDREPGCYDLQSAHDACGSCDAMPCRQSWEGSSHAPGRCEQGVCATAP